MNIRVSQFTVASLAFVFTQTVCAQGFQNLDFEAATISPAPPGYTPAGVDNPISAADAFPYWTVRLDNTVCTAAWGSSLGLIDLTSAVLLNGENGYPPPQGNFSVELSANSANPAYQTASITQTGLIPEGTQSIQFLLRNNVIPDRNPASQEFLVTLNGTPISLSVLSSSSGILTMGGDVSVFSGTTAELRFTAFDGGYGLDSITFSSAGVPEPSAFSLVGLGLLGLGWHRRRNHRT
jgi:hypothetical protein